MVLDQRKRVKKGRAIRTVGESETASSDVCSRRSGSGRVATNLTENIYHFITITRATIMQDIYRCTIGLLNVTELFLFQMFSQNSTYSWSVKSVS
jgi:hypothetical protein